MVKTKRVQLFGIAIVLVFSHRNVSAQYLGYVTGVQQVENSLILSVGADVVVFKPCTDNILMVNYRPNGIKDPDTLVVADTSWPSNSAVIDTTGDPVRITTANYRVDIGRNPLRFHLYMNGIRGTQLLCEEPTAGGVQAGGVALSTSGGNFYGVQNRSHGSLTNSSGGTITSAIDGILALKKRRMVMNPRASLEDLRRFARGEEQRIGCVGGRKYFYLDWNLQLWRCEAWSEPMGSVFDLDSIPDHTDRCTACNQNCYRDTSALMHFGLAVTDAIAEVAEGRIAAAFGKFDQPGLGSSLRAVIEEAGVIRKLAPRKAAGRSGGRDDGTLGGAAAVEADNEAPA